MDSLYVQQNSPVKTSGPGRWFVGRSGCVGGWVGAVPGLLQFCGMQELFLLRP